MHTRAASFPRLALASGRGTFRRGQLAGLSSWYEPPTPQAPDASPCKHMGG